MMRKLLLSTVTAFGMLTPVSADPIDEARIKELVFEAIRENPEIIREAITMLQEQEAAAEAERAAAALEEQQDLLFNDPNAPVLGNPDGDVTVVEFFDYNCGYCRRVHGDVTELVSSDGNVRLVMREWPILGEESVVAARASLASRKQGLYAEFHNAMMAHGGRATETAVFEVAESVGLDVAQLRTDMESEEVDAHLATSQALSQALGINGTPGFVFGDQLVPGLIPLTQMRELVEAARG